MDYPKRASLHRNYYKSDYLRQDTAKARSHQDIGNTTGDPSASHWLWTTLALNTLTKLTSTILSKHARYLGITHDWDYKKCEVHLSMPGYVECALARFRHLIPKILQHQPHKHTVPTYGATIQYTKDDDATNLLSKEEKKYIQQVLRTFLYYGRAVDSTMLTALSSIASTQAKPTEETMENIKLFINYAASHQNAILTY